MVYGQQISQVTSNPIPRFILQKKWIEKYTCQQLQWDISWAMYPFHGTSFYPFYFSLSARRRGCERVYGRESAARVCQEQQQP